MAGLTSLANCLRSFPARGAMRGLSCASGGGTETFSVNVTVLRLEVRSNGRAGTAVVPPRVPHARAGAACARHLAARDLKVCASQSADVHRDDQVWVQVSLFRRCFRAPAVAAQAFSSPTLRRARLHCRDAWCPAGHARAQGCRAPLGRAGGRPRAIYPAMFCSAFPPQPGRRKPPGWFLRRAAVCHTRARALRPRSRAPAVSWARSDARAFSAQTCFIPSNGGRIRSGGSVLLNQQDGNLGGARQRPRCCRGASYLTRHLARTRSAAELQGGH